MARTIVEQGVEREMTHNECVREDILVLEKLMTPRRIREAVIGLDNGWLSGLDNQISVLRAQLTEE